MLPIDKAEQYDRQYQRELHLFSAWLRGDALLLDSAQDDQDTKKRTPLDQLEIMLVAGTTTPQERNEQRRM